MDFKSYPKIENGYKRKFIDMLLLETLGIDSWVGLEKIHGCNFSFHISKSEEGRIDIKTAKRSDFDDNFYTSKDMLHIYEPALKSISNDFFPNATSIIVYGELYGGSYPHHDIPVSSSLKKIGKSKGLYYAPGHNFAAFDVCIDGKFLPYCQMKMLLDSVYITTAPEVVRGSFQEVFDFSPEFQSIVPRMHKLPELPDNTSEGFVIRPYFKEVEIGTKRAIVKIKSKKFTEINKGHKEGGILVFTPAQSAVIGVMELYINDIRLQSCLSKYPAYNTAQVGVVIKELIRDIIQDFEEDHESLILLLDKLEYSQVTRHIGKLAADYSRAEILSGASV